ncbi:MAG: hypothetical protein CSA09_01725 [Candidatus Contendobacter odensis]|uniref:Uncharacterized protein n=1 Tax=Candidatus Contendibacter odensensis TaxID=1400860 RepID=A0A2G6PGA8_9GAMM|nr:MAG: hypothetical protein CSA09_01725 [Candidatus Contendobacter odensis]
MKPWVQDEVFKMWTDAQKRLWESLCAAVPFQPPAGIEAWRDTYLKNLGAWEMAVRQTLDKEALWVGQWIERVSREQYVSEVVNVWAQQMEEVLQYWLQTQNQWWDEYFIVLRRSGFGQFSEMNTASSNPESTAAGLSEPTADESATSVAGVGPRVEAVDIEPPYPKQPDDLKRINGVGPALEKRLRACGINTYRQLALFNDEDIERVDAIIKASGRIRRDDWVGQAKAIHFQKYREQL